MNRTDAIALVKRFLDSMNAGDAGAALACLHDDVAHDLGGGRRSFGHHDFREFMAKRQAENNEQFGDIVVMASDDGTRAAAEFTRRGRRKTGDDPAGESYSVSGGMFLAVEDGLIIRITVCSG